MSSMHSEPYGHSFHSEPVIEISSEGMQGPPGPAGADGTSGSNGATTFAGLYNWADDESAEDLKHEVEPGYIAGLDIPPDEGDLGRLSVAQVDQIGLNNYFFEVEAGQTLIVRDTADQTLYTLIVLLREGCSDEVHACIRYQVVSSSGLPVQGHHVELRLLADSPEGTPGLPGAQWWDGEGPPQEPIPGANPGDYYLDTLTGDVYELTGVAHSATVLSLIPGA